MHSLLLFILSANFHMKRLGVHLPLLGHLDANRVQGGTWVGSGASARRSFTSFAAIFQKHLDSLRIVRHTQHVDNYVKIDTFEYESERIEYDRENGRKWSNFPFNILGHFQHFRAGSLKARECCAMRDVILREEGEEGWG